MLQDIHRKISMKSIFQNKAQIQELLAKADDNGETKELISLFEQLKKERQTFYITLEEFEKILVWKLRSQYGRQYIFRSN
jgi:ribosomal protein L4